MRNVSLLLGSRNGRRTAWESVLDGVSIGIQPGERVRLTGQNGSGKSTLISVLAGIYAPTSGTVQLSGKTGVLIGYAGLLEGIMTGIENATMFGAMINYRPIAEDLCRMCQIPWSKLMQPVSTWSSGMRARLITGVAVLSAPSIWLIDEAFYTLDSDFKAHIMPQIKGTLVFVSHSDAEAEAMQCTRTITMRNGRIEDDR